MRFVFVQEALAQIQNVNSQKNLFDLFGARFATCAKKSQKEVLMRPPSHTINLPDPLVRLGFAGLNGCFYNITAYRTKSLTR